LDIGDIEYLPIGAARKAGAHCLAHDRSGAVAAGNVGGLAAFFTAARSAQPGYDPVAVIPKAEEFGSPFDGNAHRFEPGDQQFLVLVLRKDVQERVRGDTGADILE